MIRKLLGLFLLGGWLAPAALACDICGCGVGNYYFGIMPQFHRQFVGVRYRVSAFDSHLGLGLDNRFASQETFRTAEAWLRFYPGKRWQVMAFLPYQFATQTTQGQTREMSGLGDVTALANYILLNNSTDTVAHRFKHTWLVGGGAKLPTGRYQFDPADAGQVANPNFQLGTGSADLLLTTQYTVRHRRVGLSADATWKLNSANRQGYRFGQRLSGNLSAFYVRRVGPVGLMPNLGAYAEWAAADTRHQRTVEYTGGGAVFANLGIEVFWKRLALGGSYQRPVAQHLAQGHLLARERAMLHVTLMF
jgi:hypothetical protein